MLDPGARLVDRVHVGLTEHHDVDVVRFPDRPPRESARRRNRRRAPTRSRRCEQAPPWGEITTGPVMIVRISRKGSTSGLSSLARIGLVRPTCRSLGATVDACVPALPRRSGRRRSRCGPERLDVPGERLRASWNLRLPPIDRPQIRRLGVAQSRDRERVCSPTPSHGGRTSIEHPLNFLRTRCGPLTTMSASLDNETPAS